VLFIDARKLGSMISRVQCEFTDEVIERIANTVAAWRGQIPLNPPFPKGEAETPHFSKAEADNSPLSMPEADIPPFEKGGPGGIYQDIPGYCRSVTLAEIAEHGHVLTPGRYVGAEAVEDDDEAFAEKMQKLTETLGEQMAKGAELDQLIRQKLGGLGYEF
jgi:type I restriction enzyme M protein